MNHKVVDGLLITKPTHDDIMNLCVGNSAPDCFGRMMRVTEIYGRGYDINGNAYVCYYTVFGDNSTISNSMTENECVATVPLTAKYSRVDNYPGI